MNENFNEFDEYTEEEVNIIHNNFCEIDITVGDFWLMYEYENNTVLNEETDEEVLTGTVTLTLSEEYGDNQYDEDHIKVELSSSYDEIYEKVLDIVGDEDKAEFLAESINDMKIKVNNILEDDEDEDFDEWDDWIDEEFYFD